MSARKLYMGRVVPGSALAVSVERSPLVKANYPWWVVGRDAGANCDPMDAPYICPFRDEEDARRFARACGVRTS